MKSLRLLTKQVDQWRRTHRVGASQPSLIQPIRQSLHQAQRWGRTVFHKLERSSVHYGAGTIRGSSPSSGPRSPNRHASQYPKVALATVILVLTAAMGQRFYNQPRLAVGTISPQTFRAPESASVIDAETTEEKRKAAQSGSLRILMIDREVSREISQDLQTILNQGSELRQKAGIVPYVSTAILSTPTQENLRRAEEWEWRSILTAATSPPGSFQNSFQNPTADPNLGLSGNLTALAQQRAIRELQTYRTRVSAAEFAALKTAIEQARQQYAKGLASLHQLSAPGRSTPYEATLLSLSTAEWQATRAAIRQITQRMTVQGIAPGTPPDVLAEAAQLQLETAVPVSAQEWAAQVITQVLQPNLVEDSERTRLAAEQAAEAVEPEIVSIEESAVIVEAGEEITQADFVLLDHFSLSRRGPNWIGFTGFGIAIGGAVTLFLWVEHMFHPGLRCRDHLLILLLTLTTPVMAAVGANSMTSLPAVGLLVGSFYGSVLSVTLVGLLAVVLPAGLEVGLIPLLASAAGGIVGGVIAGRLRSREELALLGGVVGLTQGVVYLLLTLLLSPSSSPIWYILLANAGLYGLIGVSWSIVALGISPYLEHLFDLVTTIRLAELSNPNRPLLKRLASEAPGTFQHTLFVASLAEAAAQALGCNVELVRAGTLYHDIGKMHDPLGFIENQMGGPNKHDAINDPWISADLIKKHVTEGLVMARKHRLPKAVQAFIPEHQGTMLITFFHHQAQQRANADPTIGLKESDFRYDGPIPQSRETGIVMLADSCEAALRSLKEATPDEAIAMVKRILRARWKDNQLMDSGLTREDMDLIANVFVRVWQQYNHQRIPYPKAALSPK